MLLPPLTVRLETNRSARAVWAAAKTSSTARTADASLAVRRCALPPLLYAQDVAAPGVTDVVHDLTPCDPAAERRRGTVWNRRKEASPEAAAAEFTRPLNRRQAGRAILSVAFSEAEPGREAERVSRAFAVIRKPVKARRDSLAGGRQTLTNACDILTGIRETFTHERETFPNRARDLHARARDLHESSARLLRTFVKVLRTAAEASRAGKSFRRLNRPRVRADIRGGRTAGVARGCGRTLRRTNEGRS